MLSKQRLCLSHLSKMKKGGINHHQFAGTFINTIQFKTHVWDCGFSRTCQGHGANNHHNFCFPFIVIHCHPDLTHQVIKWKIFPNRQSYDISIAAQVDQTGSKSSNLLDLKNPFFRWVYNDRLCNIPIGDQRSVVWLVRHGNYKLHTFT